MFSSLCWQSPPWQFQMKDCWVLGFSIQDFSIQGFTIQDNTFAFSGSFKSQEEEFLISQC